MSDIDPEFLKQLQEAFVIEAREQLQNIMNYVIQLESSTDDEMKHGLAENILHELHSMKGNSRAAGVSTAEAVCQNMESAILSLRRKQELLHADAADIFHATIDLLDEYINQVEAGNPDHAAESFQKVMHDLKYLDERGSVNETNVEAAAAPGDVGTGADASSANQIAPSALITPALEAGGTPAIPGHNQPTAPAPGASNLLGQTEAGEPPALPVQNPSIGAASPGPASNSKTETQLTPAGATVPGSTTGATVPSSAGATVPGSAGATVPGSAGAAVPGGPTAGTGAGGGAPVSKSVPQEKGASTRIALWKLDKLLRESEEMLILKQISEQRLEDCRDLRTEVKHLSTEIRTMTRLLKEKSDNLERENNITLREFTSFNSWLHNFSDNLDTKLNSQMRRQQQEQRLCFNLVDGFIDSVKSLLLQDFSGLLSLVPKVVRDLSRELHKEVDLEIFGTDIEIDRRILEEIKDPVIHLVRNSLDHGLESSEDRVKSGKAPRALLRIGAIQSASGNVELIIGDDGRGINTEKLKAAALREKQITQEEAAEMSEAEAIDLMYRSSVSTSEKLTEISGRGLGMAIVRERIHDLGGRVIVDTEVGKGTTFRMQLPTKMSTFRGIQILAAGQSFIIPTLNVNYAGRIVRSEIKQQGNRNVVNINGQLVSVQTLADVLKIAYTTEFRTRAARNYQQVLILESADRTAGFLVDEILHEHEVLVRGLSHPIVRVPNISGATILGSGQVVPVLNVSDLMESSVKAAEADQKLANQLHHQSNRSKKLSEMPVFLVDRHSTSLVMLKTLLESEGYTVNTFDDNESALEGLDDDLPLILLKSSELPENQESGLAYWVRRDLRLKDLPIVFFGSYPLEEGRKISQENGGNAYFSKVDFDRRQLLELIETLT